MLKMINLQWKDIRVKCFRIFLGSLAAILRYSPITLSDFQKIFHVKHLVNLIQPTAFYRILLEKLCAKG